MKSKLTAIKVVTILFKDLVSYDNSQLIIIGGGGTAMIQ